MSAGAGSVPRWIDVGLLPIVNIAIALIISGFIVFLVGENPFEAIGHLVNGAFIYSGGLGYTLYYATNFIFTGLAVAVAFHANLFNIGGEGQAYIGGLGAGLAMLALDRYLPGVVLIPIGIAAAALFGALWVLIPAYLQAYRGSHIVITTIMFNFIASALMVYLLVNVLIKPGQMSPETREFAPAAFLPQIHEIAAAMGFNMAGSPLNLSFVLALICCVLVWLYLWRTPSGYELRATGFNEHAAVYAGARPRRIVMTTLLISGALAGMVATNEILGVHHRIIQDYVAGYGFTGIAVSLMGRNHPVGIILASILFGALYEGGANLAFEVSTITRDMVAVIQGLIILFSGALVYMMRDVIARPFMAPGARS